jgi:CheY-like chemotaxis protein
MNETASGRPADDAGRQGRHTMRLWRDKMNATVLIVDDDEGYLQAARHLLEAEGYAVQTATSAREARRLLEPPLPDLILLDVLMPAEDGFAFAEKLSADERYTGVPIVLVTAVAERPGQMLYAFEQDKGCTAADILQKSEAPAKLAETVARALADR